MKMLSDFDGVWTDQTAEAEAVRDGFVAAMAELLGVDAAAARAEFDAFLAEVLAAPETNGWSPDGRVTAFADEDPLLCSTSVAGWIDRGQGGTEAARWREVLRADGNGTATDLANRTFGASTRAFRESGAALLDPRAPELVRALRDAGIELVVVSNSRIDKLEALFGAVGLTPGEDLRLRGSAGKWRLGDGDEAITLAGRRVLLDRPLYRELLVGEDPDLIVGDVFSLDLALPSHLRANGVLRRGLDLVLRRHAHTPEWVLADRAGGRVDSVVDDLAHVVEGVVERR